MRKIFARKLLLGFLSSGIGFPVAFLYFTNIEGSTPLLLGVSAPLIFAGVYFLGGAAANGVSKLTGISTGSDNKAATETTGVSGGGLNDVLQKNNKIINEWSKTNQVKSELEILEMSAAAEENASKGSK